MYPVLMGRRVAMNECTVPRPNARQRIVADYLKAYTHRVQPFGGRLIVGRSLERPDDELGEAFSYFGGLEPEDTDTENESSYN